MTTETAFGIDVGGTFTDLVRADGSGELTALKIPTRNLEIRQSVREGVERLASDADRAGRTRVRTVHGTTIATNLILEGKGSVTGMITTRGFRDLIEIGTMRLPVQYDFNYQKVAPLVPRRRRFVVTERVSADGEVVIPLDEEEARSAIRTVVEDGAESLAICLLHSNVNPQHEHAIRELAGDIHPHLFVSLSSELATTPGEFQRFSTAVVNAYVQPKVSSYLSAIDQAVNDVVDSHVLVMQSSGGLVGIESAARRPAQMVESGPAAGVLAAAAIGRRSHPLISKAIAFDMGGTTAKASLVEDAQVSVTLDLEVGGIAAKVGGFMGAGGYPLRFPAVDLAEVGAGAGSIVRVDEGGALRVGPDSAGASPGPVCYGQGGELVTVTDVNVVLGFLNGHALLGGTLPIDRDAAVEAVGTQLAAPLGHSVDETAWAAHQVANSTMMSALRAVTTQRGRDPREAALIAFGGSGPVHAHGIGDLLGVDRIIVPPFPGVFSAIGLLNAAPTHTALASYYGTLRDSPAREIESRFSSLTDVVNSEIQLTPGSTGELHIQRYVDLRCKGQGSDLTVPVESVEWNGEAVDAIAQAFISLYENEYRHSPASPLIEITGLRVTGMVERPAEIHSVNKRPASGSDSVREVYFDSTGRVSTPVLSRDALRARGSTQGPVIVEEYDSTTVVRPSGAIEVDDQKNLVITRRSLG